MKISEYWGIIKLFFKVKGEITTMKEEKPAWRSTAGMMSILSIILTIYGGLNGVIGAELSAKIAAAIVMVFTVANAIVKFTPSTKDDELLAKIEAIVKEKAGIAAK